MCQACGRPEHQPSGRMEFNPHGGSGLVIESVQGLLDHKIGVSPYAVMMAFGSVEAAKQYVEGLGRTFDMSMLQ